MDDQTQQARDALLTAITKYVSDGPPRSSAQLRDLAEAYQRVTGSPAPPPGPVGEGLTPRGSRDW